MPETNIVDKLMTLQKGRKNEKERKGVLNNKLNCLALQCLALFSLKNITRSPTTDYQPIIISGQRENINRRQIYTIITRLTCRETMAQRH